MTQLKTTKPRSNKQNLLRLLRRERGASVSEIVKATGWQPHSTRAALTGLRKAGYTIDSEKSDKVRRYRIAAEPSK